MVCGNITGQLSYPIRATILNPTVNTSFGIHSSDSCQAYIISTSVLATVLCVSVVVSIIVTVIVITIARRKVQAGLDLQLTNQAEKSRDAESMYEDVTGPLPSASAINTQDNVAYHHSHKQQHCFKSVNY